MFNNLKLSIIKYHQKDAHQLMFWYIRFNFWKKKFEKSILQFELFFHWNQNINDQYTNNIYIEDYIKFILNKNSHCQQQSTTTKYTFALSHNFHYFVVVKVEWNPVHMLSRRPLYMALWQTGHSIIYKLISSKSMLCTALNWSCATSDKRLNSCGPSALTML